MNLLDILILAFLVFLIVRGIFRGFVREVGSLAGILLGIWAACVYHPLMTGLLRPFFPEWKYLSLLSVGLILVIALIFCNGFAWLVHKFLKKILLGWADRSLGVILAILKGVVAVYFAIVLITFFVPAGSSFIADSKLAPAIVHSYQSIVGLLSPDTYENLKKTFVGHKDRVTSSLSERKNHPAGKNAK